MGGAELISGIAGRLFKVRDLVVTDIDGAGEETSPTSSAGTASPYCQHKPI